MKTGFLVALLILTLSSCKKNYSCDCTTTETTNRRGFISTSTYKNTTPSYTAKMTRTQAEAACNHEEEAISSSYENWWTENGTSSDPSVSISTSCKLIK